MKNIIHITTFLQGGAGKIICDLAYDQVQRGNMITCIMNETPYPDYFNYPEYETRLSNLGVNMVKVSELFKREISGITQASKLIAEQLLQSDTTLIHSHSAIPSLASLLARDFIKSNIPIIHTMHGWGSNKTKKQEIMDIDILSKVDSVITVSNSSKHLLINKGILNKNISTIYNGVADARNQVYKPKQFNFTSLPKDAFIIGCIGSICDRKNQSFLLNSIEKLLNHGKNVYCIFIGEDNSDYAQKLKERVRSIGMIDRVKFLGYLDQADQYISEFDVLVLPTKAEGLPLSIIEAFRENTLVIASNIPECRELIQHGYSGFLFNLNSTIDLTSLIIKVLNLNTDEREKITNFSYRQYVFKFQHHQMLNNYNSLYLKTLESRL